MAVMEINMSEIISSITVTVKVSKTTRIRMWLGTRAMGIAARIFGCNVEISDDGGEEAALTYDRLDYTTAAGSVSRNLPPPPPVAAPRPSRPTR